MATRRSAAMTDGSAMASTGRTRRRGAALEAAILDAAWGQLAESGYPGLTFEAVAERARTGKAALYRRWPDKEALVLAALRHRLNAEPIAVPDTGLLRDDTLQLMRAMNTRYTGIMPTLVSVLLGAYFGQTRTTPAEMRARVLGDVTPAMEQIIGRAVERGELAARPPAVVAGLPYALLRHDLIMTLEPMTDERIVDIVDTVFMPLVAATGQAATGRSDGGSPV